MVNELLIIGALVVALVVCLGWALRMRKGLRKMLREIEVKLQQNEVKLQKERNFADLFRQRPSDRASDDLRLKEQALREVGHFLRLRAWQKARDLMEKHQWGRFW